jgi:hypothetical protein
MMFLDPEMCVSKTVTIVTDGTESTVLDISHYKWFAIFLPSNWITGTITFKGCATPGGTFIEIVHADDVGAVTIASVAASKCIVMNGEILEALLAVPFIKLVAGAAQTTNDKIITITMKR